MQREKKDEKQRDGERYAMLTLIKGNLSEIKGIA